MAVALTSDPIVAVADVTSVLGHAASDKLNFVINGISKRFLQFTRRERITSGTVTEWQRSLGLGAIWLHATPVTAITSVEIYDEGTLAETLTDDVTWHASGRVCFDTGAPDVSRYEQNIKIVYEGGWTTVPDDLQQTAMELIGLSLQRLDGQTGVKSVSFDGQATNYETADLPQAVRQVWERYRIFR